MKKGMKVLAMLLAVVLTFALVACGNETGGDDTVIYTDEENYAVFKAGVESSLGCDNNYSCVETLIYSVDGVAQEIDGAFETRDGNRFMYEYTESTIDPESQETELALTKHLTKAVKLVTVDGEQKYKDCHKQLLNDGSYEQSGSYVAEKDLGYYISTEHSPKTILSGVLPTDETYADFVGSLKNRIAAAETDRGITADMITVSIGRDSIDETMVTVSATVEGVKGKEGGKPCTGNLIWTFVVSGGKVTGFGYRDEIVIDKGDGTTGSINNSMNNLFKYTFDEDRYDEIQESDYPVLEPQEETVV